jgi:hypothetical protein
MIFNDTYWDKLEKVRSYWPLKKRLQLKFADLLLLEKLAPTASSIDVLIESSNWTNNVVEHPPLLH